MRYNKLPLLVVGLASMALAGCPKNESIIPLQSGRLSSPEVANKPFNLHTSLAITDDKQLYFDKSTSDDQISDIESGVQSGEDEGISSPDIRLNGEVATSLVPDLEFSLNVDKHYTTYGFKYQLLGDETTHKGIMAAISYRQGRSSGESKDDEHLQENEIPFVTQYDMDLIDYAAIFGYRFNSKILAYGSLYHQKYDGDFKYSGADLTHSIRTQESGTINGISLAFERDFMLRITENGYLKFTAELNRDQVEWENSIDEKHYSFSTQVSYHF